MNKEVIFKGIPFKGQFPLKAKFKSEPGVYIIADRRNKIADIGETENLRERVAIKKNVGKHLWFYKEPNSKNRIKIKNFMLKSFQLA